MQIEQVEQSRDKTESDLQQICLLVHDLRTKNLAYCESLLNMHSYFRESKVDSSDYPTLKSIFISLNTDLNILKKSFLRKFIIFSNKYDPFFLYHYQLLKRSKD